MQGQGTESRKKQTATDLLLIFPNIIKQHNMQNEHAQKTSKNRVIVEIQIHVEISTDSKKRIDLWYNRHVNMQELFIAAYFQFF